MTIGDIIRHSLQLIGALAPGEAGTSAELSDGLFVANAMLNDWSADGLMTPGETQDNFALVAGTSTYNIGVGQTFNTAKPIEIVSAFVRDASNYDYPLDIITANEYWSIPDIAMPTQTTVPDRLFYDPGVVQQATQVGKIRLYPTPDTNYTLFIQSMKYFTSFVGLTDTVTFPEAYTRAVIYNLAVDLAPRYGRQIVTEVAVIAQMSKRTIRDMNSKQLVSNVELGQRFSGTIYTM